MTILVTGSAGMIGSNLCQELIKNGYDVIGIDKKPISFEGHYEHFKIDLGNTTDLDKLFHEKKIGKVIHLAALAHTMGGKKYPKKMYVYLNVECANNVFQTAANNNVPVLFISTVDVFGFQKSVVSVETVCKPVTIYGKTKYCAEEKLRTSGIDYDIFRFSPVYTPSQKRDIQKRIYLKYPNWAYQIGKNTEYEVLDIKKAIYAMIEWCSRKPSNSISIIKDDKLLNTKDYILEEKASGNARHVLKVPRWIAVFGYYVLRITGKNRMTFLLSKAVFPLRTS